MAKKKRKRGRRGYRGKRKPKERSQSAAADSDDPDRYSTEIEWAIQLKRLVNQYCDVAKPLQKGTLAPLGIGCILKDMARDVEEFHAELEGAQTGLKLA